MAGQNNPHGIGAKIVSWWRGHIAVVPMMFIVATIVGGLSGACAHLLKLSEAWVSDILTSGLHASELNWPLLLFPAAGLVLTGVMCRYLFRHNLSHGVRRLMGNLRRKDYAMRPVQIISPMVASTVTLGFGGSAGSEGPIACTGAAIGGNFARWFGFTPAQVKVMICCGAGAGIAGIFKAPLGGALFTLEVLRVPLGTIEVLMLLVSTITAGMTAYALSGFSTDVTVTDITAFDPRLFWAMVALGVFCGFYSLYYSYVMKLIERLLVRIRSPWIVNLAGGAILSVCVFLFPALYGEGYGVIGHVVNGDFASLSRDGLMANDLSGTGALAVLCLCVVALKCFATSATNSGGGVSGDFAPALFAGCVAGLLFAIASEALWGIKLPAGQCAIYAMAGVMAGAIRAPLMAIVLTTEMLDIYSYFFPVMIVAALSFGIVRLFTLDGYFARHLDRKNGLLSILFHKR